MKLPFTAPLLSRYTFLIGLIILIAVAFSIANPNFYSIDNIGILLRSIAVLFLISMSMTLVMITGGIDLSVGSNIAFSGGVGVIVLNATGNPFLAAAATLLAGGLIGAINGFFVARLKLSAFMITLATMALARGLGLVLLKADALGVNDEVFLWLGRTSLGPLPVVIVFVAGMYLVLDTVLKRSSFGKDIYAVGSNAATAFLLGRRTEFVIASVYILSGVMAGVGAIVTIGRVSSAQPWVGTNLEFDAITAVILGGTSLFGGEGRLLGTIIGVVLYGVIINGLILTGANPFLQDVVKGSILLGVVVLDTLGKRRVVA